MDLRTESADNQNLHQHVEGEEAALRFEHICLSFEDGVDALQDVSFTVKRGQTVIIFGAAGSGKSVLLKTAIGLLKPDSGKIWLFGQEITELSEEELFAIRPRAGILFQESALFDSQTVEENVAYPLLNKKDRGRSTPESEEELERKVREALRFVEL